MADTGFHFSDPLWLLAILAVLPVFWWLRRSHVSDSSKQYLAYADKHLLPLLLDNFALSQKRLYQQFLFWSAAWLLICLALAGPRWDFHDVKLFRSGSDLIVLLDLSASMDLKDVAPSRLGRARQEIEDIIEHNDSSRLGLIAFASTAHIVSPLTDDSKSLRAMLPALSTELVQLKGSRLENALLRAEQMLAGQPEDSSRHILVITDGDYNNPQLPDQISAMATRNIHVHFLGVGTSEGTAIPTLRDKNGEPVQSVLDEQGLEALAQRGNGIYRKAVYKDMDTNEILQRIQRDAGAELIADQKTRVWNERFYWPVIILMLILLPQFRGAYTARKKEAGQ